MNGSRLEPYIGQCHFTESQNVARLRKALKGDARENVKSLLYSGASADDIPDSLQRYFGRPEILILNELENIKKMPKLAEDGRNMNVFARNERPMRVYEPCETRKEDRFIKETNSNVGRQMRPQYDDSDVDNDNENRHREPRVETTAIITNDERRRTFDKIVKIMSNMQKRTLFERLCNFHSVTHRRKMGTREESARMFPMSSNTHYRSECRRDRAVKMDVKRRITSYCIKIAHRQTRPTGRSRRSTYPKKKECSLR
ncbi:hypothetical protein EVAR_87758_1 [Eumeta japonica]|uniref:Uncharacterized protein n=1 Tax=Eumeta variegata TaxID=151549 RepID=A0A4C1TF38_EUMVA|nr:hypothetical protein EVAR_87758_1 [Eumeta japonica]